LHIVDHAKGSTQWLILALRQNDETRDVDYKAATAWDEKDKAKCCSIVKDVLAMANTGGGLIIFGVDKRADGSFNPSGMPDHMLPTWETTQVSRRRRDLYRHRRPLVSRRATPVRQGLPRRADKVCHVHAHRQQ